MIFIPDALHRIHRQLQSIHAKAVVVGGYVRDALMGELSSKDIDIEVYGLCDIEKLKESLNELAPVHEVGRSFGVLKLSLDGYDFDISLPRLESKSGRGHRGFTVELHGGLSFKSAAKRRDFTMNAVGYDLDEALFLDPYRGEKDIKERRIRSVDAQSFIEDPLRVLRAVQFAARFGFTLEAKSLLLCQEMVREGMLDELPKERVFEEIKKLLLKSSHPSVGFELLDQIGALFPELKSLKDENKKAYEKTMRALDIMAAKEREDEREKLILMLAVLCHDLGTISALDAAQSFLRGLSDEKSLIESVLPLVAEYQRPSQLFTQQSTDALIRRLSVRVSIYQLIEVTEAIYQAAFSKDALFEAGRELYKQAKALGVLYGPPQALIQGRDLMKRGLKPGLSFKVILSDAYEAQLEGIFSDSTQAQTWLDDNFEKFKSMV